MFFKHSQILRNDCNLLFFSINRQILLTIVFFLSTDSQILRNDCNIFEEQIVKAYVMIVIFLKNK